MSLTVPNMVTLFRIGLVPVLMVLLLFTGPTAAWLAGVAFLVATLSDYVDGYIARSYGSGSVLGTFLDPLADKLLVSAALIMLAGIARWPRVPAWMVVVIVGREIMVTALRAMAASEGLVVGAEELGKYKMTLQAMAVQALLIHYTHWHVDFFAAGMFLLWIAMAVSIWSGAEYYLNLMWMLREDAHTPAADDQQSGNRAAHG
ncbi:MAG: CDP-diacylglycerol--glycerol-3-phosphate 3-phosphatidyltransferase [Candidatus Binataceae bacterium]